MKLVNNQLYIKPSALRDKVIDHDTLYKLISKGIWDVIEDEIEGKLIPYSQLKKAWQAKVDGMFGGNAYQYAQFQLMEAQLVHPEQDYKLIDNYTHNGLGLRAERKAEYKKACSVLAWLAGLRVCKHTAWDFGCISIEQFWLLVRQYIAAKNIKLPTSRRIIDKLEEYRKDGALCLVHKGLGNDNSAKLANDKEAQAFLMQAYASAQKISAKEIWRHAQAKGINVCYQTVQNFLETQKINLDSQRHGGKVYHNRHELRVHRRRLHAPHLQWEIDGTVAPLWFINDEGKPDRMYLATVMDSMSRAFIGYAIGYTEDTQLMIEAMKDAMRRTGYKPFELVSDHGAALMSGEFSSFLEQWHIVHKPAQVGRARSKVIEPMQGVWMSNVLRYEPNFSGMNISATADDSKANPDFLKAAIRSGEYTKEKVVQQIRESVGRYNNLRLEPDRPTCAELLKTETEAQPVTAIEYAENCMMWRKKGDAFTPYAWSPDGIVMQFQKKTYYYYPVLENENPAAFAEWMNTNAHQTFFIKYDPTDLDQIALYVGDGTEKGMRFKEYATLAPVLSPSDRWATDEEKANRKYINAVQKLQTAKKGNEMMLGLNFADAHKEAANEAEQVVLLEEMLGNTGVLTDENSKKAGVRARQTVKKLSLNSQFDDIQD